LNPCFSPVELPFHLDAIAHICQHCCHKYRAGYFSAMFGNEGRFFGKVNEPVEFWVRVMNLLQIPARSLKNLGVFSIEITSNKP
jgi:hypothetical protein